MIKILSVHSNRLKFILYFTIFSILILQGCKDNSTNPDDNLDPFSFNVKVVDDNNNPIRDVKVGVYFNPSFPLRKKSLLKLSNPLAATTVRFALDIACYVNLNVFNLDNAKVQVLINDEKKASGVYQYNYNTDNLKGGVYKIVLATYDSTKQNVLFKDSIYMVYLPLDMNRCQLGVTDASGNFKTTEKTLFPSLYILPPLIRTGEADPSHLGTFSITDTVTIILSNSAGTTKIFDREITNGANDFTIKFSEGNAPIYGEIRVKGNNNPINQLDKTSDIKLYWMLEHNYPNPFN